LLSTVIIIDIFHYVTCMCSILSEAGTMPQKVRQLKATLAKAGFTMRPGKGSHTVWQHPELPGTTVTLAGNDGKDAQPYQVDDVKKALKRLEKQRQ
jgi:predicted RNA binding protein YcfA (HicA-like mRNA interferase family)